MNNQIISRKKTVIERDKRRIIIQESYRIIREKEQGFITTKSGAISKIVEMIKKELKKNDN